jgi:hypothetical protein
MKLVSQHCCPCPCLPPRCVLSYPLSAGHLDRPLPELHGPLTDWEQEHSLRAHMFRRAQFWAVLTSRRSRAAVHRRREATGPEDGKKSLPKRDSPAPCRIDKSTAHLLGCRSGAGQTFRTHVSPHGYRASPTTSTRALTRLAATGPSRANHGLCNASATTQPFRKRCGVDVLEPTACGLRWDPAASDAARTGYGLWMVRFGMKSTNSCP